MENNQLLILRYLINNGKVMFPVIHNEYDGEMTTEQFKNAIHSLSQKKMIEFDDMKLYVEITEKGISETNQIENQINNELKKVNLESVKSNLEIINLKLQNENLEYSRNLRDKESEIRTLTTKNLKLQNKDYQLKTFIGVIGFLIGFLLSNIDKVLKFLGYAVPKWLE